MVKNIENKFVFNIYTYTHKTSKKHFKTVFRFLNKDAEVI